MTFGPLADYIRTLPCVVCHQHGVDPHHVKTRGAGGKDWLPSGDGNLVPLCSGPAGHHMELHRIGRHTFAARHGVDLQEKAKLYGEWFTEDPQPQGF